MTLVRRAEPQVPGRTGPGEGHWRAFTVEFTAQQSASGILRVWLSTHNDPWRYRHGLALIWERIQALEDLGDSRSRRAMEAARELMEYTGEEGAGGNSNRLDSYRDSSGDGAPPEALQQRATGRTPGAGGEVGPRGDRSHSAKTRHPGRGPILGETLDIMPPRSWRWATASKTCQSPWAPTPRYPGRRLLSCSGYRFTGTSCCQRLRRFDPVSPMRGRPTLFLFS